MGIGDFVTDVFGSENKERAVAPKVDPNAYQYGGRQGYAQDTADRYRSQADQAQWRGGVNVDYGQANQDRGMAMQSREGQAGLAQAMNARAMGQTPSIAQMQADRQMQQANAAQSSAAASARGAAGIAMAQQNAANNVSNQQSAISNQAQINAANERMQAEQSAFGAYSNMRGGDMASQQQSAQQAQYQAQLADAQRARNDSMTLGMTQNEMGVQNTQLSGQMNQQAQQSANALGAAQINAGVGGQNASTNQQNAQGVMGMAQSAGGAIAGALADGGRMKGSAPKPYLVGERGPELVLPKKDGFVVPAEITSKMLAGKRADGGDIQGSPYVPTSTWGVGKGVTEADADRESLSKLAEGRRLDADRDARLASGGGGGMAIAGGPGTGTTLDEPLRRADQELISLARAKQAEGIELSPEEERKLGGAQHRSGSAKKADRKMSIADYVVQMGKDTQKQAAAVDTSYHGPTAGYVPPQLIQIAGSRADGGPISPIGGGGQGIANPAGHNSAIGRLAIAHDMPSIYEVNKATFRAPGPAALMAPGSGVATHGYGVGSIEAARAEGGPVTGADNWEPMPLYEPPGKMLQSTPEGRPYYVDEPTQGPSLAKVMSPQPKESPIAARTPVSLPPSQTKQRNMSDDELMAWANKLQGNMQSDHENRMAQGPSVSLASRMRTK